MVYNVKIIRADGTHATLVYDDDFGAENCTPEHVERVKQCIRGLDSGANLTGDQVSLNACLHAFTVMFRGLAEAGVGFHPGDIQALLKSMGATPFGGDKTRGSA